MRPCSEAAAATQRGAGCAVQQNQLPIGRNGSCMDGARGARGESVISAKRSGAAMLGWTAPLPRVAS